MSYIVLDYDFKQVILSILNLHWLVQQFINCHIFSSIKEANWLIQKGICAILFDVFYGCSLVKKYIRKGMSNIYFCRKLTFSKPVGKVTSWRENLKRCTSFEEQKGTSYIQWNVYFGIIVFSYLSSIKPCLRFLLLCFAQEIKGFYQSSLEKEVDFRDIMNVVPNILAKNENFKKLTQFCR